MRTARPGYDVSTGAAERRGSMQIEKQQVIEFLEARGDKDAAERAQHDLPDPVDTEENSDQIALLGIDQEDLTDGLGG